MLEIVLQAFVKRLITMVVTCKRTKMIICSDFSASLYTVIQPSVPGLRTEKLLRVQCSKGRKKKPTISC